MGLIKTALLPAAGECYRNLALVLVFVSLQFAARIIDLPDMAPVDFLRSIARFVRLYGESGFLLLLRRQVR